MIIVGLDISKVHYALSVTDGENTDFMFTTVKKGIVKEALSKGYQAHYLESWQTFQTVFGTNNPFAYTLYASEKMKSFLVSDFMYISKTALRDHYIAVEGYSMGSETGQLTQIAEVIGCVKSFLYVTGWRIRVHDPQSVKMFATSKGHATKEEMIEASRLYGLSYPHFLEGVSEQNDVADAFFLMKMLETELKVRNDPFLMKKLPDHQKHIFNRVTKSNPVNILDQDFVDCERIKNADKH
jgi:hypothetical protein